MKQLTFRLKSGDDLKQEIAKRTKSVQAGVLLSTVGSLGQASLRMAGAKPGREDVRKFNGPFEIVSGTGTFSQDGLHVHISISDKNAHVFGGHLKDGCIVETTAEVVIGVFENVVYQRIQDEATGFKELSADENS